MTGSLIHWMHPVRGAAACGTSSFGVYVQRDFYGTIASRDPTILKSEGVSMKVNCKKCIAIHEKWLDAEMRKLQTYTSTGKKP